ncbi:magnesium transporter MgtE N-terminal domain-containing protein [Aquibacillus sediminis]|uniref:MotE family protein n=1 Tax=Aquibacillus sediminis TaxID=2574734 RepID=UPI0011094420|nr:hypothetical protein [Aquibacillus sediminis]
MARNSVGKEKNKAGVFQWFLVIVIPLLFAIVLAIIILSVAGVDVKKHAENYANNVPFISGIVTTNDEKIYEQQQEKLNDQLKEKNEEIRQLNGQIQAKDGTIDDLNAEVDQLNEELTQQTQANEDRDELVQEIATSFKEMDPEAAAPIINSLDNELSLLILKSVSSQERGQILSEMAPEDAAQLTNNLLN